MKDTTKKDWPQEKNNKSRKKCFGSECRVAQHSEIAIAVEGCPQKVQNSRLAATGLFAVVANAVARRTREIGIRMVLGGRPGQVLSSILKRTLALGTIGVAIGAVVTLAAGRLLSAILYGVSPRDPVTYATAILLMAVVALLACWHPATRAVHIDPARTLRED